MLTQLTIKNYALIDELQVNFSNGLSIITGETGAGKSILLGGLSLVLGKRADLSSVKDASKKCVIEATFDIAKYNLKSLFKSEDLDYESVTIVRREILPSGKSRAFINDTPVNLDSLQLLGNRLLDIHSQHHNLNLNNHLFQLKVLDAYAGLNTDVDSYKQRFYSYNKAKKEYSRLIEKADKEKADLEYYQFRFDELEDTKLIEGEQIESES